MPPKKKSGSSSYNYDSEYLPPGHRSGGGGGGGGDNQIQLRERKDKRKLTCPSPLPSPSPSPSPSPNPTASCQQDDGTGASLTQHGTGKSHFENATRKEIGYSFSDPNLALIHHAVMNKYGDIGRECTFVDLKLRTYMLERIYKVVQELDGKTLDELDENLLSTYDILSRDAESAKFNVTWLRKCLDELRDRVKSFDEIKKATTNEKIKVMKDIDDINKRLKIMKETVKTLNLEIEESQRELVVKTSDAERLSCIINGLATRCQRIDRDQIFDRSASVDLLS